MTMLRSGDDPWTVALLVQRYEDAPGYASPATWTRRSRAAAAVKADPLGAVRVDQFGSMVVAEAARRWHASGVRDGVVRERVDLVRLAVGWAVAQDLLVRDSPVVIRGLAGSRPRTQAPIEMVREMVSIAQEDLVRARTRLARRGPASTAVGSPWSAALAAVFRAHQSLLIVSLAADAGLRRGELAGLRSDDLEGRDLWVERAVKSSRAGVVIGPPKTYAPERVVVSAATAHLWRDYLGEWFGPPVRTGVRPVWLLCHRPPGCRALSPATVAARFGALAGRVTVGGASVSLHRVRHTVATTVVALGDPDRARRRLRHRRLDTTLRHYVDTTGLVDDTEVADALESYYRIGVDFLG